MTAVIQRVRRAKVTVEGRITGEIGHGLLVLLGVAKGDAESDAVYLAEKICGLRIFSDDAGKMNLSVLDKGGALLVVSQFTLLGDCRRGRRPGFDLAAPPDTANPLYEFFCRHCVARQVRVEKGVFQAHMDVELVNDGPVTFVLDSRK
ncbi:MAG: D-tyrosyl-tRNA(Tyr) deacylase [Acidobacteria bacterium]|nr:D-tyrosyl-tRNA(Tyr) deacylase [Acidobacteriota bacterium]